MADAKPHSEPSMEEILASIRRIIAEEDPPAPITESESTNSWAPEAALERKSAAPIDSGPPDQILDLTERIDDEGLGRRGPGAPRAPEQQPEPQFSPPGRLPRPPP